MSVSNIDNSDENKKPEMIDMRLVKEAHLPLGLIKMEDGYYKQPLTNELESLNERNKKAEEKKKAEEEKKKEEKKKAEEKRKKEEEEKKKAEEKKAEQEKKAEEDRTKLNAEQKSIEKKTDQIEPKNKDSIYNFYWVRHAESVSNMFNNKPTDKYSDEKSNKELLTEIQNFLKDDFDEVKKMKEEQTGGKADMYLVREVYDYINSLATNVKDDKHKDLLDACPVPTGDDPSFNFVKAVKGKDKDKTTDPINPNCISILKDKPYNEEKDKTKKAEYFALWLRNFIPSNFLFQPTLSSVGVRQAEALGDNLLSMFDVSLNDITEMTIYTSATVRTMMTAYLSLSKGYSLQGESSSEIEIYVMPFINEKENDAAIIFVDKPEFHDFTNAGIHPDDIDAVAKEIKEWCDTYLSKDKQPKPNIKFNTDTYAKNQDLIKEKMKNEKKDIDNKLLTDFNTKSKEVKIGLETALKQLSETESETIRQLSEKIKKINEIIDELSNNAEITTVKYKKLAELRSNINNIIKAGSSTNEIKEISDKLPPLKELLQKLIDMVETMNNILRKDNLSNFWDLFYTQITNVKNNILVFSHGKIIADIIKETGANIFTDTVKNIEKKNNNPNYEFETWSSNTAVFKHEYTKESNDVKTNPIKNICLVKNFLEQNDLNSFLDKSTDESDKLKTKFRYLLKKFDMYKDKAQDADNDKKKDSDNNKYTEDELYNDFQEKKTNESNWYKVYKKIMEAYLKYPDKGIRKDDNSKALLDYDKYATDKNTNKLMLLSSDSLRGKIAEITHSIPKTGVLSVGGKKRKNRKAMFSNKKRTKRVRSKPKLRKYTKRNKSVNNKSVNNKSVNKKSVNKKHISKKRNKSLKKKSKYTKKRY